MALTLIANLDPGLQCRNTLNAVIDLVGANHPWTSGSIPYTDSTNDYAQDNSNFFWDATNKLLTSGNGFKIKGTTSGIVTLNTKAVAGTWTMTLPDTAGTSGYVLSTNGSGITSWIAGGGGGGSTILSGSGAPADALGSTGDYYVDEDGNTLYGPKIAPGTLGPDQYAIPPSMVPVHQGSGSYELSTHVKAAAVGQIVAVRYWRDAATAQIARTVNVWTTGGTLLSSGSVANDGGGSGWKQVTLTTPVSMVVNDVVIVSVGNTADYSQLNSTLPVSNGGDISIVNGGYGGGAGSFPGNLNGINYFVDAAFQAPLPAWAVAIDGDAVGIGAPVTGSTSGSVLFVDSGGNLAQDATFFWDNALSDLHIGNKYYINASPALYVVPGSPENNWFEGNAGSASVTGYGNFGTGDQSLLSVTSGYQNLALGTAALRQVQTGYGNIAVGTSSLRNTVSDFNNVALGAGALVTLGTSGAGGGGNFNNICIGYNAMNNASQAYSNVVLGSAGLSNVVGSSVVAHSNTVIGEAAASSLGVSGGPNISYNTFIGSGSGLNLTGGIENTWVGRHAGPSAVVNGTIAIADGRAGTSLFLLDCHLTTGYTWSFHMASNTVPAKLHIYNHQSPTHSTTNYDRATIGWEDYTGYPNIFRIGSEAGGTGVVRLICIDGFTKAGAPANTDLYPGSFALIDDTSAGQTWLVFNKAGTIRKVQLT